MEGEAQVSDIATVTTPEAVTINPDSAQEVVSQETTQTNDEKPAGFDRVEFTPEQKARVDRIYGNMKRYESDAKELREYNQRLIDTVNQLAQGQQQIVSHLQGSDFQEAEARLAADRDAAWAKGDVNAFNTANDKLHEIKTQRLLAAQQTKTQPQQPQLQKPNGIDGERIVNASLEKGSIDPTEANIARSWMMQADTTGNLLRPWTQPNHPNNYAAAKEADAVFNSPMFADKSMADKLREVDRRMGIQTQQQNGQNVLPAGNLTRGKQTNNIKLDPKIADIAVKTKFAGRDPKLTSQDHINAWQKAVAKNQPKGASR